MDAMKADANPSAARMDIAVFDEFYDRALPVVYGYVLRLCGGDAEQAWDLTQDTWVAIVDRLAAGHAEVATIGYAVSVARSKYLDAWRRGQRLQRKLRLVWSAERDGTTTDPSSGVVLEHLADCSPAHRVVLMLAYVDDVPVGEIARELGMGLSSTYSLLHRARAELRDRVRGALT